MMQLINSQSLYFENHNLYVWAIQYSNGKIFIHSHKYKTTDFSCSESQQSTFVSNDLAHAVECHIRMSHFIEISMDEIQTELAYCQ